MVIATQNPIEFEGTYPLPESQLDRFLLRIPLGYPAREIEAEGVAVTVRDETEGALVEVDRSLMKQLLLNLLQNAVMAAASGGPGGSVTLVARRRDEAIVLEVIDDGPQARSKHQRDVRLDGVRPQPGGDAILAAIRSRGTGHCTRNIPATVAVILPSKPT